MGDDTLSNLGSYYRPYGSLANWGSSPLTPALNPDTGSVASFVNQANLNPIAQAQASSFISANPTAGTAAGLPGAGNIFSGISNWFDDSGFMQRRDANGNVTGGWGQAGLGVLQGLGNAYLGYQQLQTYKQALQQSKDQFNANYAAQRQTTNTALEDRQRARIASNPGAYESVGSYMDRNGIK